MVERFLVRRGVRGTGRVGGDVLDVPAHRSAIVARRLDSRSRHDLGPRCVIRARRQRIDLSFGVIILDDPPLHAGILDANLVRTGQFFEGLDD